MNNSRQIVNISLLLGTIIAVGAFAIVFNSVPVQALHKEQQFLESFDNLADYAKAVRSGDSDFEEIPIQSMKAANIYDDANDSMKDCIDQAAKIGDSLTDREIVHCVDDVNYFNNKLSNDTVPTSATTGITDTGADTSSTSNSDTNTDDSTSTSNSDTNSDSSTSDNTSTNNQDNNDQSSNNNNKNPEDYDDLNELVKDIKNGNLDTEEISLSAFQNSGAYQGADQETQDCIDLAGKIGHNLGDQEIVKCSEDPNFYRNEISGNNNADSSNNADNNNDNNADNNNDNNN